MPLPTLLVNTRLSIITDICYRAAILAFSCFQYYLIRLTVIWCAPIRRLLPCKLFAFYTGTFFANYLAALALYHLTALSIGTLFGILIAIDTRTIFLEFLSWTTFLRSTYSSIILLPCVTRAVFAGSVFQELLSCIANT